MLREHSDTNQDADALEALLRARAAERLMTVDEVADVLRVDAAWVYQHAEVLGVLRLGSGRRSPLRFEPATLAARLLGMGAAKPARATKPAAAKRSRPQGPAPVSGDLLPINHRLAGARDKRAA